MASAFQTAFGLMRESTPHNSQNNNNTNIEHTNDAGPNLMELLSRYENGGTVNTNNNTNTIDWEAVDLRLDRHPEDCKCRFRNNGERSLSVSCPFPLFVAITKRAPTYIIKKIIDCFPEAVWELQNPTGLSALYLAVAKHGNLQLIQLLLDINPQAASKPAFNGSIALHSVEKVEIAQLLLDVYPEGIGETNYIGYLPLHRAAYSAWTSAEVVKLFIDYGIKHNVGGPRGGGGVFVSTVNGVTPLSAICDIITHKGANEERWSKFCYITSAAAKAKGFTCFHGHHPNNSITTTLETSSELQEQPYPSRILQNAIRLGCPDTIIQFAHARNPIECTQYDEFGRSPLTYACMGTSSSIAGTDSSSSPSQQNERNIVIQLLVDAYPQAASKADCNGRLPLHYYAASVALLKDSDGNKKCRPVAGGGGGSNFTTTTPIIGMANDEEDEDTAINMANAHKALSTLMALIRAEPRALETLDVSTKLYPFMMAAVAASMSTDRSTTTASSLRKLSSTTASWLPFAGPAAANDYDSRASDDHRHNHNNNDALDEVYFLLRASPWLVTQALERRASSSSYDVSSSYEGSPSPNIVEDPSSCAGTPRRSMKLIIPAWLLVLIVALLIKILQLQLAK